MLVAGWLQRQQPATIEYLKAENRMLQGKVWSNFGAHEKARSLSPPLYCRERTTIPVGAATAEMLFGPLLAPHIRSAGRREPRP